MMSNLFILRIFMQPKISGSIKIYYQQVFWKNLKLN